MAIVGGSVHRRRSRLITWTARREMCRRAIVPADWEVLREWLVRRFAGRDDVVFAVQGCTGWRYVVEELERGPGDRPV